MSKDIARMPRDSSTYVSMLDKTLYDTPRPSIGLKIASLDPIRSYGDRLVDILCKDSSNGHDICKVG